MVRDDQLLQQLGIEVGLADRVDDRRRVEAQVQEDAQVAELEVRVDERRLAAQPRPIAIAVLMAIVVVPTPPFAP